MSVLTFTEPTTQSLLSPKFALIEIFEGTNNILCNVAKNTDDPDPSTI